MPARGRGGGLESLGQAATFQASSAGRREALKGRPQGLPGRAAHRVESTPQLPGRGGGQLDPRLTPRSGGGASEAAPPRPRPLLGVARRGDGRSPATRRAARPPERPALPSLAPSRASRPLLPIRRGTGGGASRKPSPDRRTSRPGGSPVETDGTSRGRPVDVPENVPWDPPPALRLLLHPPLLFPAGPRFPPPVPPAGSRRRFPPPGTGGALFRRSAFFRPPRIPGIPSIRGGDSARWGGGGLFFLLLFPPAGVSSRRPPSDVRRELTSETFRRASVPAVRRQFPPLASVAPPSAGPGVAPRAARRPADPPGAESWPPGAPAGHVGHVGHAGHTWGTRGTWGTSPPRRPPPGVPPPACRMYSSPADVPPPSVPSLLRVAPPPGGPPGWTEMGRLGRRSLRTGAAFPGAPFPPFSGGVRGRSGAGRRRRGRGRRDPPPRQTRGARGRARAAPAR